MRVEYTGAPPDVDWDEIYDPTYQGWQEFLGAFRHYIAHHAGVRRHKVHRVAAMDGSAQDAFERSLGCIDPQGALDGLAEGDDFTLEHDSIGHLEGRSPTARRSASHCACDFDSTIWTIPWLTAPRRRSTAER